MAPCLRNDIKILESQARKTALVAKVNLHQSLAPLSLYLPKISLSFFMALDYLLSHVLRDPHIHSIHSPAFYFAFLPFFFFLPCFPSHCCACAYCVTSLTSCFSMTYDSWLTFILVTLISQLFILATLVFGLFA